MLRMSRPLMVRGADRLVPSVGQNSQTSSLTGLLTCANFEILNGLDVKIIILKSL